MGLPEQLNTTKNEEAKAVIDVLLKQYQVACEIAKTAMKNRKSLSGDNYYSNKFHTPLLTYYNPKLNSENLLPLVIRKGMNGPSSPCIETLKLTSAKFARRAEALKQLRMIWQLELLPRIAKMTVNPVPETEQVLAMAVIKNTRGYIEKIVQHANGCYEYQWYDAYAVMIRRLVEMLIEPYEARGKSIEIQDKDGNYLMLKDLVDRITSDKCWNLGRETKQALPLLKSVGDRSAHNRRYLAKKPNIDRVLHGLRVAADDLLHVSGLK